VADRKATTLGKAETISQDGISVQIADKLKAFDEQHKVRANRPLVLPQAFLEQWSNSNFTSTTMCSTAAG